VTDLDITFRREWPRILSSVVRFAGDLQRAEDAVQEAFARAAATPPGSLRNPASWITTTAKRIVVDDQRRQSAFVRNLGRLAADAAERHDAAQLHESRTADSIDDDRLELLFMVSHPSLTEESRLALALRAVCGVSTAEIATLFFVKEATMAARLTRAKQRIQSAGIRLQRPDAADRAERLDDVLSLIYLLYTTGHTAAAADGIGAVTTTQAAIALGRSVVALVPRHLEARGVLALMLLTQARSAGRVDTAGNVIDLESADRSVWDTALSEEGIELATIALAGRGRFALEAGISGLHSQAARWEDTDWVAITSLYDALARTWPSPGVQLGRVVARSYLPDVGPAQALIELDAHSLPPGRRIDGQLAAVRGDLLRRSERWREAVAEYRHAIDCEANGAVRAFLRGRISSMEQGPR
jgi:RNA polymerase sigma-70 factor (ECF subfamily)